LRILALSSIRADLYLPRDAIGPSLSRTCQETTLRTERLCDADQIAGNRSCGSAIRPSHATQTSAVRSSPTPPQVREPRHEVGALLAREPPSA
jgi:hypothetical protein